jgi:mannose-6-phosphate isomerase-like protein (cupin superfamily)
LGYEYNFTHPVDELVMVVEGKLEVEMQGRIFYPEVGEEIIIPAKVNHTVRNIGGTTSKWLCGYKKS